MTFDDGNTAEARPIHIPLWAWLIALAVGIVILFVIGPVAAITAFVAAVASGAALLALLATTIRRARR